MRLFVTFLAFLCLTNSVCFAQRSRSRNHNREKITVEELIQSYRFNEAVELLEENISKAKKRKKNVDEFESQLERVHSLQVMLSATEKVKFVDSMVVDKKEFLSAYILNPDCGIIASPQSLLPDELSGLAGLGKMAYCNELNDMIYFPLQVDSSRCYLNFIARIGDSWSRPKELKGLNTAKAIFDYPFVLSDGVTTYFSAKSDEGLGGYDIYVTRYNSDTDSYLKPENIGMPFNSMANDYMYVIDEANNLGWFATDRNQPEGKVCIYIFQPNVTREVYNTEALGEETMRNFAIIRSIKDSRLNDYFLAKARERLESVKSTLSSDSKKGEQLCFVISDTKVYTSLLDFKSKKAQNIAMELVKETKRLKGLEKELKSMRQHYQKDSATPEKKAKILDLESTVYNMRDRVNILQKNMRKAELKN